MEFPDHPTEEESYLVSDFTGRTFFLLLSALKTAKVTAVFDSCHSGGGTQGNMRIRSFGLSESRQQYPTAQELQYREQWLSQLGMSRTQFQQQAVPPAVILSAAQRNQFASDMTFEGFHAGAFTYTLSEWTID